MRVPLRDLAQELLQHVVVRLRPVRPAPHAPEIDDVADQVDDVGVVCLRKSSRASAWDDLRAQMNIGDEKCSIMDRFSLGGCRKVILVVADSHSRAPSLLGSRKQQLCITFVTKAADKTKPKLPTLAAQRA